METAERLLAIEEMKQCKARYWRAVDSKQFSLLESVFTEDAIFDKEDLLCDPFEGQLPGVPVPLPSIGRAMILENAKRSMHEKLQSMHMGHIPEISLSSETTAEAIFPFEDRLFDHEAKVEVNGYGYYVDHFVKVEGQWRIRHSKARRYRILLKKI